MKKHLLMLSAGIVLGCTCSQEAIASALAAHSPAAAVDYRATAGTVVFTDDFTADDPMGSWTVADANNDGVTFGLINGLTGIWYNSDATGAASPADDWLFSPAVELEADQDYIVSYTVRQQGAFDYDEFELKAGTAAVPASMDYTVSETTTVDNGSGSTTIIARLTAPAAGTFHFGLHITTPYAENGQFALTAISVTAQDKATPNPVTDLAANSDPVEQNVTLTWTNPTLDTTDAPIIGDLSVNIYENETLIATIADQTAGAQGTYTYSPESFVGDVTYTVAAVIGDNESTTVSTTINLDDNKGDYVLVESFKTLSKTDVANYWVIENLAGTAAWDWRYKNTVGIIYSMSDTNNSDWIISPAVQMDTDKRYVLKYQLQTGDGGASLDVTVGTEQNSSAQTQVVNSHAWLYQNGMADFETPQFTVAESGDHYIGFHVYYLGNSTWMRYLEVYYVESTTGIKTLATDRFIGYNRTTQQVALPEGATSMAVYNLGGSMVINKSVNADTADLSQLAPGIYIVSVKFADGQTARMKIAK